MEPFRSETRIDGETRALSLLPRFNLAIQSIEMSVQRPDGGTEILFFANDIPLEWPTPYIFGEPVLLPRGSLLRATAYFENTSDTPLLAREVGLGTRTALRLVRGSVTVCTEGFRSRSSTRSALVEQLLKWETRR